MPDRLFLICSFAISLHPLFHMLSDQKYRCQHNQSLYLIATPSSRIATQPLVLVTCISLGAFGVCLGSCLFIVPLLLLTWKLFISDRFVSLARGQGAPGYFSFLNIFSIFVLQLNNISSTVQISSAFTALFQSLLIVEFGAIFLSAGLFKLVDRYHGNSMAFALGLLNPMWSKIYNQHKLINASSLVINYLGPCLQVIGGLLILTGVKHLMMYGYIIIGAIFALITPQTRLAWLCPSISAGAFIGSQLVRSFPMSTNSSLLFFLLVFLRLTVMRSLFAEYFSQRESSSFSKALTTFYRKSLGVIIWKVFTFDIVRFISTMMTSACDPSSVYSASANTNVYDSITMASLLSSQEYLPKDEWNWRMCRALLAFHQSSFKWLKLEPLRNATPDQPIASIAVAGFSCTSHEFLYDSTYASYLGDYSSQNVSFKSYIRGN